MIDFAADLPAILSQLIACESVTGDEKNLCDILEKSLGGIEGSLQRKGNSLVFRSPGNFEQSIALVGHIDTVPIGDSTTESYVKDKKLFGRGACDMKAGLAVMLKIIDDIEKKRWQPGFNLSFVFYEGEEGPVPNGINTLLDEQILTDLDFAFILEPTEGRYSVGCLGSIAMKKEVQGVSAHSANPRTGENALKKALEIYNAVKELNSEIEKDKDLDGLPFYETVNVTALNTFNAFNVLPPKAELMINYRFSPERSLDEALNLLYSRIGRENTRILDAVTSAYCGKSIEEFLLPGTEREIMQAWTDMAQLIDAGIPAVNYGPGSIKQAHKPDEHIVLEELESFYSEMIKHLR